MSERAAADLREQKPAPAPKVMPEVTPEPSPEPGKEPKAAPPANTPSMADPGEIPRFQLRAGPILLVAALGLGLPLLSGLLIDFASDHIRLPSVHGARLPYLYMQHGVQTLLALIAIGMARRYVKADFGLHLPRGKTYIAPAICWGLLFGIATTAIDYAPQILAHVAPKFDDPLTQNNVIGWLFFEGVYVGPTEEILFRSLLVTLLAAMMPGKVRYLGYEMNGAGVVVAVIFALAHLGSFVTDPFLSAFLQQFYALAIGIFYAYWLEKSKSVVAPIIGHNVADATGTILLFSMIAAWQ